MSIGVDAAEHRQTNRVEVALHYSCPDLLTPGREFYPGPTSKPGHRGMRRLTWHSGVLSLASKAPQTGRDVYALGEEIREALVAQLFRDPLPTMLAQGLSEPIL